MRFSCFREWLGFEDFLYLTMCFLFFPSKQDQTKTNKKKQYEICRFRPAPETTKKHLKNNKNDRLLWPALETRKKQTKTQF